MSSDVDSVTPVVSPSLTDGTSDISPHASPISSKLYHITEPWGDSDPNPSASQPATPRTPLPDGEDQGGAATTPGPPEARAAWEASDTDFPTISPITSTTDDRSKTVEAESPGVDSDISASTVENLVKQANLLIRETSEKGSLEQMESSKETSSNTTYRDLPRPGGQVKLQAAAKANEASTKLADREVELLSAAASPRQSQDPKERRPTRSQDDMDIDFANKVKNLMSETGWRDRRFKSFDYDALKEDLADIERRLQTARNQSDRNLWPEHSSTPQRKSHSLHDIQAQRFGSMSPTQERTQSPDTLTSSGKASSLAELDRNRRLKWDYAADIASAHDNATPDGGLSGADDLNVSGEHRLRMSISQASFVSSPDPDDSALEVAMKTRDYAVLQEPTQASAASGSISARMEEILSRQDPQSHVAAILQQADEAERRLRARLRQTATDGAAADVQQQESYLEALRSAHRETRTPLQEEASWKRLNLSLSGGGSYDKGLVGQSATMDSARSEVTTSGGDQANSSGRQAVPTSARSETTAESTHAGSDDAMGPNFPPSAYGSRAEPTIAAVRGIYHKPKSKQTASAATPQALKSPGFPQRSRVAAVAAEDSVHRSRPPASPSAGCADLRKSLETISSHDTGAETATVASRTPEDPASLEEYASKLRSKWERYQRLLSHHEKAGVGPVSDELRDLLQRPVRSALNRTPSRDSPASGRKGKSAADSGKAEGDERRGKSGGGRSGGTRDRRAAGGNGGGVMQSQSMAANGGRDRDSDDDETWGRRERRRAAQEGYGDTDSGDETHTDTQDTLQLMTRMAGLLRAEEAAAAARAVPEFARPDQSVADDLNSTTELTVSELDPQLLRLKHLFLKQKEKWLYERSRELSRRKKIRKLQRMITERIQRRRHVEIAESLDTDTIASSFLSDMEELAVGPTDESEFSSANTMTADSPPPPPPPPPPPKRRERRERQERRERVDRRARPERQEPQPVEDTRESPARPKKEQKPKSRRSGPVPAFCKSDRRIQEADDSCGNDMEIVYPPAQTWEIPAPGRDDGENKENCKRGHNKPKGVRRMKPNEQFVEKLERLGSSETSGVQAAGAGVSWYHPVSDQRSVSEDDSAHTICSRHEIGVQGDPVGPRFDVPSDGVDPLIKLAQPMLTEAFEDQMGGFISRSRERQKRIRLAAEERRYVSQMEAERVKLFTGDAAGGGVRRRPRTLPDPLCDNHHQPSRRAFTRKEMREQNKRIIRALPEVQQRVLNERKEAQVKSNILRKQLYSEKVLRAVLRKRGPWVLTF